MTKAPNPKKPEIPDKADPKKAWLRRPLNQERLLKSAYFYLQRYATSRANLIKVLERRIMNARRQGRAVPEDPAATITAVMAKIDDLGLLNDRAFGETLMRRLRGQGTSRRGLVAKLRAKGLEPEMIEKLLAQEQDEGEGDDEITAALAYARRRRLGPYRDKKLRADFREKDLAALARRGFSYDVALAVIDGDQQ